MRRVTVSSLVLLALLLAAPRAAWSDNSRPTCAEFVASTGASAAGSPAENAADAYRTACILKKAGLSGNELRAVAAKAAEIDPTVAPPTDLLSAPSGLVPASHSISDQALALATIAGVVGAVLIGLLFVITMIFRATLGRWRTLRNLLHFRPAVTVEPAVSGGTEQLKTLPWLLQSVLGNLGTDFGGQNIQFVSPSSDDVSEVELPASAPAQLEYLSWVIALLRPLAPKDRVTVRLAVQPEGRQGLGLTATLIGGHRGRTINSTTLWEADIGLGGIANDEPVLGERERYQLLVAPLGAWAYFTLADLTQRDEQLLGTRNWRSYGLFSLGCRLYQTHRERGQRLLREAIDADPSNLGAHLNILLLEFDSRRTDGGKRQLQFLRNEVQALPGNKLCPSLQIDHRRTYWYDPTWYRTMYSLTAVCAHMVSKAANGDQAADSGDDDPTPSSINDVRIEGEKVAMELIGACWLALSDMLDTDGQPKAPKKIRGKTARLRFRQREELALFLGQMLPSSILLLVNLRMLDGTPASGVLSPVATERVAGSDESRKQEWKRRADALSPLDPLRWSAPASPPIRELLSVIDPVEFLPARARYNMACLHSEQAQYQDRRGTNSASDASKSRRLALDELAKGLDHDSAQWAREDPALWEVRTNTESRPEFADLVAEILCTPNEWSMLADLPFIGVAGASRLWIGADVKTSESLRALGNDAPSRDQLILNPLKLPWVTVNELEVWIGRATLRAYLAPRLGDGNVIDRVEGLLHRLGIATSDELLAVPPWQLSRRLVELAPADLQTDGMLTPSAVEVWAR